MATMTIKLKGIDASKARQLEAVLQDEDFMDSLTEATTAEEVRQALQEKGVDFTLDEVEKVREAFSHAASDEGELSEDELEDVAGGTFTLVSVSWTTKRGTNITVNIPW